jgi:hypothetical protein
MITPEYKADVVVGGTGQTTVFKALPDSMVTRQSGDVTLIHKDPDGLPFDISSLTGSDFKTVPVDSGETWCSWLHSRKVHYHNWLNGSDCRYIYN